MWQEGFALELAFVQSINNKDCVLIAGFPEGFGNKFCHLMGVQMFVGNELVRSDLMGHVQMRAETVYCGLAGGCWEYQFEVAQILVLAEQKDKGIRCDVGYKR